MSQLPRNSERQLTIHDVLRPLRRSILATDWLARVETARDQAEEALRTEFDEISRAHVGYKLPPKALRGKLGRMVREYQNLSLHSLYTNHQIGHYVERLERGLESRLTSPSQPPILHAKHIEDEFMQIGLARSSAVVKSKTDYQLWEHPSLDSGRQSVNGPCVAVRDGALYIASRQYRGVFMVEPLALNGDVNPAVQLTIEYPNC